MKRMTWTAIGAAGLMTGASIGGFAVVNASAADRAVRPVELQDVVNVTTGEPRSRLIDGSVDSATGLPKPLVTIAPGPAAAPTDSADSIDSSAEVVAKPIEEAAKPKANAKPKSTVARPAATASADSTASVASAASVASVASVASAASVDSADSADGSD